MPADWGADLWDQYDSIAVHTQKGIDFLEKFSQFYKERCQVEFKYARDLKNMVKNFQPKSKKEDEDNQLSFMRGFNRMAGEVHDLAAQHERLAEDLQSNVVMRVQTQAKELRDERKKYLDEAVKHQKHLDMFIGQHEKAKKAYEKAFKEAQRAHESYLRADENQELSRKAVEDAKLAARRKQEEFESAKQDYAAKLQETNQYQRNFYHVLMPGVFQRLQEVDQRKTQQIRDSIKQAVEIERKIQPIIERCLMEMVKGADEVAPETDSQIIVDRYKSGFEHPVDIPFWNLEETAKGNGQYDNGTLVGNHYPPLRNSNSLRGTQQQVVKKDRKTIINIFPGAKQTKESTGPDFADLPPQQRKRRLREKMDTLQGQLSQESLTRDALMKMKGVYEANPSMGDPNSVNGQLAENAVKLEALRHELQRLQNLLDEVEQSNAPQSARHSIGSTGLSSASLPGANSNGFSTGSPHHPGGSVDSLAPSRSPSESSIPPSHASTARVTSSLPTDDHEAQDLYEPAPGEFDEILGTCLALYDFDGQSDGALSMIEGEELQLLEVDQGDGWTHVRRGSAGDEGFVPTSYIKCNLFHAAANGSNHRYPG